MSESSVEAFLDNLVRVLLQDVGFYIPKSVFLEEVLEKIDAELSEHFFDVIFHLDLKKGTTFFDSNEFNERLMKKPQSLENNIIQLLQKKGELGEAEFDYVLEKYFDKVNFYSKILSLLSSKLVFYSGDKVDFSMIGSFELQFNIYKNHLLELINRFYNEKEVKEYYDIDEIFAGYLPDFLTRLGVYYKESTAGLDTEFPKSNSQEENKIPDPKEPTKEEMPKKRIKKEPLITDKEAEDFILTSVFNVKIDQQ